MNLTIQICLLVLLSASLAAQDKIEPSLNFRVEEAPSRSDFFSQLSKPASRFMGWDRRYFYISTPLKDSVDLPLAEQVPFGPIMRIERGHIDAVSLRLAISHKVTCIGYEEIRQTPPSLEFKAWASATPRQWEIRPPHSPDIEKLIQDAYNP